MSRSAMMLVLAALALQAGARVDAQVRRDPFARPAAAVLTPAADSAAASATAAPAAPPRLRAVLFEPGKSLVNIDGRILAVGDSFDDYRIAAIGERSATLIRRGIRSVIVLDEESSK
jgi:hypothetical protein